ncbi:MAG: MnmC family methyltransferase [Candidatus Woesearchaeota archaeon]
MSNLLPFTTADGSLSFRNIAFDEMYHTKSGAREEAFEKHARPIKVWEKENPIIYDVCFGLGYNAAAAIDLIRQNGNKSLITVYIFENDLEILEQIPTIDVSFDCFVLIQNFIKKLIDNYKKNNQINNNQNHYEHFYTRENIKFIMLLGDARKTILEAEEMADFVFFDPFSPTHHPEMWELSFIKDVYAKMNVGGKLTTYSYARIVRETFAAAGFKVIAGPIIGRKSPSTIAIKE